MDAQKYIFSHFSPVAPPGIKLKFQYVWATYMKAM